MKRKIMITLLVLALLMSTLVSSYADTTEYNKNENLNSEELMEYIIGDLESEGYSLMNSAPSGVTFGSEQTGTGNYEIQGKVVSLSVSAIVTILGVSGIASYITDCVTNAIEYNASHVFWYKKIAYGEDSNYYYVRTKIKLFRNAALTKALGAQKTVYTKKSKHSGASEGNEVE